MSGGEGGAELARASSSSNFFFSFLPIERNRVSYGGSYLCFDLSTHTVVALGNAVLDASSLGQIRDLGPVLVWVGAGTEGTARAMTGRVS